jgi:hypothetical protein
MKEIEKPKTKIRERLKTLGKESWGLSGDLLQQMKYKGEVMAEKYKEKQKTKDKKTI